MLNQSITAEDQKMKLQLAGAQKPAEHELINQLL